MSRLKMGCAVDWLDKRAVGKGVVGKRAVDIHAADWLGKQLNKECTG